MMARDDVRTIGLVLLTSDRGWPGHTTSIW